MLPDQKNTYTEVLFDTEPNRISKQYFNDYYEIHLIYEGKGRYFINHTIYDTAPFDIMIINKEDFYSSQNLSPDRYERYIVAFSDKFLDGPCKGFDKEFLTGIFRTNKIHLPESMQNEFMTHIKRAERLADRTDMLSEYQASLSTIEILLMLNSISSESEDAIDDKIALYEDRIQEICRYLCKYYAEPITLEQMSQLACMSPTYFSKRFKQTTGSGFKEYLNNLRIKKASEILIETEYSIAEVASMSGYRDSNYFGDVFKRLTGMSPYKFRKEHRC